MTFRATGPINQPTPGLLAKFGLKTFGAAPQDVSPVVTLNADIDSHIMAGTREVFAATLTGSVSANTQLFAGGLAVPQNEVWLIDTIGFNAQVGAPNATQSGRFSMLCQLGPGGALMSLSPQVGPAAVSIQLYFGLVLPRLLLVPSGALIGMTQASDGLLAFTTAPVVAINLTGIRLRA